MKVTVLYFECDNGSWGTGSCMERTTSESTWGRARNTALVEGWQLGLNGRSLCPKHRS